MTSNVRRKLALKIIECLGGIEATSRNECGHSPTDAVAAAMSISKAKNSNGFSPEILVPIESLQSQFDCKLQDINNRLSLNQSEFPYARISDGRTAGLAFGVQNNFFTNNVLKSIINSLDLLKDNVYFSSLKKLKIIVEFSSPNIAKPFHAGHLRSTILGNFVANIHQAAGHDVTRLNYLGDWGAQFGTLAKGYQLYGDQAKLDSDPIQHLYEVYIRANKLISEDKNAHAEAMAEFWKLENDDPFAKKIWDHFRQLSVEDLAKTYKRLGIRFDCYEGESEHRAEITDLYAKLKSLGLLIEKTDGTKTVEYSHPSGIREVILQKSDGTSLYLSRDIAAAISRMDRYKFDHMFYVVENGQSDHFLALFDILQRMKYDWSSQLTHVKFGRIRDMSTRKGTAVFLRDILDEARSLTVDSMRKSPNTRVGEARYEEIGDIMGVASVLINDMRSRRLQDFQFNWTKMTQTKGDTGLFLLYVHARLCSLEDNCGVDVNPHCDLSCLKELDVLHLIYELARYEDVCTSAYVELQPCTIAQYLLKLGRTINKALDSIRVKGQTKEIAEPRLLAFAAARRVLADGMEVLGLIPLREM